MFLDRGIKILEYIGNVIINGFLNVEKCLKLDYELVLILIVFLSKIVLFSGMK